jgi:WD40 repeat protein
VIIAELKLASKAHCCCFSPNGRFIAVAASHTIYLWDITGPDPCLIQTLIGHSDIVTSLVFSSSYNLISASDDKSIKFWQIGASSLDPVLSDPELSSLTPAPIAFVSLQARDGLAFSIDSAGVVKTWDIMTGCCKKSHQTQAKWINYADIQLINDRLIIVGKEMLGWKINVWDAERGKLYTIHTKWGPNTPSTPTQGLRMIGDGSRVLQLYGTLFVPGAWDQWTLCVLG